eukprot:400945_1
MAAQDFTPQEQKEVAQHEWQETKSGDENKAQDSNCCVVVIGTTGVGKSSLIKLNCGDMVKASNSTKSCTKGCTIFTDKQNNKINWMDTQGTDDNELKDDDEKVLKKAFKALYDQNITKIKLIWIVSGDMDRERGEYKKQAKFIHLFSNKIWESCLIIHKKGMIQPKLDNIKGAIAASQSYGSRINLTNQQNQNKHLVGYTCLEWTALDDATLQLINMIPVASREEMRKKFGYLTSVEITESVHQKLSNLPEVSIEFLHQKCSKCGVIGDHRFITDPCHTESEKIHTDELESYHPYGTECVHTKDTYSHQYISSHSSSRSWYHSGSFYYRHIFGSHLWDSGWSCCSSMDRKSAGCEYTESSTPNYSYTTKYRCCDESEGSIGCTHIYQCCKMIAGAGGCEMRYKCCQKTEGDEGCTQACKLCHVEWGKGTGCQKTCFMDE